MRVRLNSDFTDWYDHQFAGKYEAADAELVRIANDPDFTLSKRQQFKLLEEVGLNTPINGEVSEIAPQVGSNKLVVYLDEFAHRGEGKVLLDSEDAIAQYPNHYCSVWIDTATSDGLIKSNSWRLLQIGNKGWWLKYQNPDSWLSNVGENVSIKLGHESNFWEDCDLNRLVLKEYALFAIDFVFYKSKPLAIDFNPAPGMKWTGIEKVISAKEIYSLIVDYIASNCQKFAPKID
jgi:hypothetical protein